MPKKLAAQSIAAMVGNEFQVWAAVENAAEHQPREGKRRVERPPKQSVIHVFVRPVVPLAELGMRPQRHTIIGRPSNSASNAGDSDERLMVSLGVMGGYRCYLT